MEHVASLEFLVLEGMSVDMIIGLPTIVEHFLGLFTEMLKSVVPEGELKLLSTGDLDFGPGDLRPPWSMPSVEEAAKRKLDFPSLKFFSFSDMPCESLGRL